MRTILKKIMPNINKLLFSVDTDDVASKLAAEINEALDKTAPLKRTQIHNKYAPHISENTKQLMKERNELRDEALKTGSNELWNSYKKARNTLVAIQKREKIIWAERLIGNIPNDSKKIWAAAKTISGDNKKRQIGEIKENGIIKTNPKEIATTLNTYFSEKIKII